MEREIALVLCARAVLRVLCSSCVRVGCVRACACVRVWEHTDLIESIEKKKKKERKKETAVEFHFYFLN